MTNPSSLVGTGDVDKGAIFNSEGTSVWAATPGFSVQPAELKEVVAAFKEPGDVKTIQGTGFHIAGEKYITLRVIENRSIYGKKVCRSWSHQSPTDSSLPQIHPSARLFLYDQGD